MLNIFGHQGNSAKIFGIKGARAKNILGNKGKNQKKIKGSWEHVPPWEGLISF